MGTSAPKLLLIANPDPVHVGAHLLDAAASLGVEARLLDVRQAFAGPDWWRAVNWRLFGHRPANLRRFSAMAVETATCGHFTHVLTTGLAPVTGRALRAIGAAGATRLNFLTDDPWNPAHRAPWFAEALREYDQVFTPRRSNVADLQGLRGPRVTYVPFAYAPAQHFHDAASPVPAHRRLEADVMFAGGADADRIRAMRPCIEAGLDVALYGGYWDRHPQTRPFARGFLSAPELRLAVSAARVCLCLVRSANRDGHAMRTFEVAAMGGCMLVEDTYEHREILGDDGLAVRYFRSAREAATLALELIHQPHERERLSRMVMNRITAGGHTYANRLAQMLGLVPARS